MQSKATAQSWYCGERVLSLNNPLVMGVLNITPDSLSDGGRHFSESAALEHGFRLIEEGADILDIGGESTRPGATAISVDEELRRVMPVVYALSAKVKVPLSIDTRNAVVAGEALDAGVAIINTVTPLVEFEPLAILASEQECGLAITHTRGTPATMLEQADYTDVTRDVAAELSAYLEVCRKYGIKKESIVIDPGIGFAKRTDSNLRLLADLQYFSKMSPLMVGVSRKRFIGELCSEDNPEQRLGGSIAAAVWCVLQGASIIRTHDVKATRQALQIVGELVKLGGYKIT